MSVVEPRPAATVVVVRDHPDGPEVLLVRRSDHVAFMAGAYVFPGGRVDAGDTIEEPDSCCAGVETAPRFPDLSLEAETAHRVAALRELVEEAGLLVAGDPAGAPVAAAVAGRIRAELADGTLVDAVRRHGVRLALDALVPFAHWVTPETEARRYDTRFFVTTLPEGQVARHDAGETTAFEWIRPAAAVERCRAGDMRLAPPTWTTLRQLARAASVDALFAWARAVSIVRIQPRLHRDGRETILTLPGDALMPAPPGWEALEDTRFALEEGRGWTPVRASSSASTN